MKQIIKIQEQYGAELHTRQMMERLAASLVPTDEYLLDMSGVEQISRSAADELYNLTHGNIRVELINLEPFVEKMIAMTKAMTPYKPSMKLDADFHRPMEIDYLYSRPIEEARKAGCPMPKLEMLEQELRFIQSKYL